MEKYDGSNNKGFQECEQARAELLAEDPEWKKLFDHPLNANQV